VRLLRTSGYRREAQYPVGPLPAGYVGRRPTASCARREWSSELISLRQTAAHDVDGRLKLARLVEKVVSSELAAVSGLGGDWLSALFRT
jgi:hypothetical protein